MHVSDGFGQDGQDTQINHMIICWFSVFREKSLSLHSGNINRYQFYDNFKGHTSCGCG